MHDSVMRWAQAILTPELCADAMVLEVGSLNVNGSLRNHVTQYDPQGYVGIDMQAGPGVDIQMNIRDYGRVFADAAFDLIICTEMLEHAHDWRTALLEMHRALVYGGMLILTTRSEGFPYHGYPYDYWRFSPEFMRQVLAAMGYEGTVETDHPSSPGVLVHARDVNSNSHTKVRASLYSLPDPYLMPQP